MVTGCVRLDTDVLATNAPTTDVPTTKPAFFTYSSNGKREEFGYTEKAIFVELVSSNTSDGRKSTMLSRISKMARGVVARYSYASLCHNVHKQISKTYH